MAAQGPAGPPTPPGGSSELSESVYATLRALAQQLMLGERRDHTLTATALVNETYLRLSQAQSGAPAPEQFYYAAAQAMRHVLIDHARRRKALKRAGNARRIQDLENVVDLTLSGDPDEILALDDALVRLEESDTHAAAVVRLRFFAGLTGDQTAAMLGISPRQADREWAYARAFLLRALRARSHD